MDFCAERKSVITSTFFRLHNRHRCTWKSPNGTTRTQFDYILINQQWKQSVNNSRTCPSADCDSDHNLVMLTMTYSHNVWLWSLDTKERRRERLIQFVENKCKRKLLGILWTRLMMTNKQVYEIAQTESELLSHVKSCYFGHVVSNITLLSMQRNVWHSGRH